MIENGWKIKIFTKDNSTEYDIYYLCRCENVITVEAKDNTKHHDITCHQCGNILFLTLESFFDSKQHLHVDYFNVSTHTFMDNRGWHAIVSYYLPFYEIETDTLKWKSLDVLRNTLNFDGTEQVVVLNKYIEDKAILKGLCASNLSTHLKQKNIHALTEFVNKNLTTHLSQLVNTSNHKANNILDIRLIIYCLKNPSVQDLELFYWNNQYIPIIDTFSSSTNALNFLLNNRKEKSVRKALFEHYKVKMQQTPQFYDPTFDYVILRIIDDPNYLSYLLSIPSYYKNNMFQGSQPDTIITAFNFLKEHYTQKNILNFIKQSLKIKNTYHIWIDCFRMLSNSLSLPIFVEHFERCKPKVTLLHDELVRVQNQYINSNKIDMLEKFKYTEQQLKTQLNSDEMNFRLPSTAKELHAWGKELNNCMFSYTSDIQAQNTLIYGVFKGKKLTYAVEIRHNKVVQIKAINNRRLPDEEKKLIHVWQKKLITSPTSLSNKNENYS